MADDSTPRLTIRVSTDSGRTFGPVRVYTAKDNLTPLMTSAWPPCQCLRCRPVDREDN